MKTIENGLELCRFKDSKDLGFMREGTMKRIVAAFYLLSGSKRIRNKKELYEKILANLVVTDDGIMLANSTYILSRDSINRREYGRMIIHEAFENSITDALCLLMEKVTLINANRYKTFLSLVNGIEAYDREILPLRVSEIAGMMFIYTRETGGGFKFDENLFTNIWFAYKNVIERFHSLTVFRDEIYIHDNKVVVYNTIDKIKPDNAKPEESINNDEDESVSDGYSDDITESFMYGNLIMDIGTNIHDIKTEWDIDNVKKTMATALTFDVRDKSNVRMEKINDLKKGMSIQGRMCMVTVGSEEEARAYTDRLKEMDEITKLNGWSFYQKYSCTEFYESINIFLRSYIRGLFEPFGTLTFGSEDRARENKEDELRNEITNLKRINENLSYENSRLKDSSRKIRSRILSLADDVRWE